MTTSLIILAFVLALYYPFALVIRSNWRANAAGRSQFIWSAVVALVLGLAVARALGWMPPEWLRAAVYLSIVGGLVVQDATLTKIQNRRSARLARERKETEDAVAQ